MNTLFDEPAAPSTVASPSGPTAASGQRLPHLPALDGLRGAAVAGVLVFHGGFAWATGGFLGVSTFFTLSGFLITALLLREHRQSGRIALGTFWIRRVRRLLPAALAALVLAQIVTLAAGTAGQRQGIGGDTIGALLYSANWRSVLSGQSYGALFDAPSPLLHFWSLAVEEQFYLLYPLVVFGALGVLAWNRRRFAGLLTALLAASLGLMLVVGPALGWSVDRLYFGTDTRMAELLVGALLATLLVDRIGPRGLRAGPTAQLTIGAIAIVAIVVIGVMWHRVAEDSAWLYRGGLLAHALATAAVLVACLLPRGPVQAALSLRPLRGLGQISYGLYLYHWPIFLLLSPDRTGLDGWPLFVIRCAASIGLALVSYRWLELPFRRGTVGHRLDVRRVAPFTIGSLVLVALALSTSAPERANDFEASSRRLEEANARASAAPAPSPAAHVPRFAVFGDSTALTTGLGLGDELSAAGTAEPLGGATELGCGIGRGGQRRTGDAVVDIPDRCNVWEKTWADTVRSTHTDLAMVQVGPWDVKERLLPGDTEWRTIGDPTYDEFLLGEMTKAVDVLSADGAHVVWLTTPPVADRVKETQQPEWREPPPVERVAAFNRLIEQLPSLRPGKVAVVDLAAWLAASGHDEQLRPDGVHLDDKHSQGVAHDYLAAAVLQADQSLPPR